VEEISYEVKIAPYPSLTDLKFEVLPNQVPCYQLSFEDKNGNVSQNELIIPT